MRKPKKLSKFSDFSASHDGKSLAMLITTIDGGDSLDLEIPFDQIGDLIEVLVSSANHVGASIAPAKQVVQLEDNKFDTSPIPVSRIGLAHGATPDKSLLVVRMAGFDLGFSLTAELAIGLARDGSQYLKTLSADPKTNH
jgi:hypothetical protein